MTVTGVTNSVTNAATGGLGGSSGQNTLTLSGTNLSSETINYVLFTSQADTKQTYQVPPGTVTDTSVSAGYPASMPVGTYTVTVGISTGPLSGSTASFQICEPIATINPQSGPLAGNTPVAIVGTYLDNASNVFFGSTAAGNFNSGNNTDTSIDITAPTASSVGSVKVSVVFPGSSTEYGVGQFSYNQPRFTLSGFYPNFASGENQPVNVQGSSLSPTTVSAVELWYDGAAVATAEKVTFADDGSSLTFLVPSGLTVDVSYSIVVVATNSGGNVFATAPGSPNFSYVSPAVVAGTTVFNAALTNDSTTLTLAELLADKTLTVLSTGDFTASGDLFIQTTKGVAILNYTGTGANTTTLNAGYYTGQFTGVTQYTKVPAQYAGLGDFDTSTSSQVLQSHASVFQASVQSVYEFNITQQTGSANIEFFAYYSTVPASGAPASFVLDQVSGQTYQWKLTAPNESIPTYSLPAGTTGLSLPLIPTNSACFIFTRGAYSPAITTNASGGIPRPSPYAGNSINANAYDFVEYTFDSTAGDPNVSLGTRMLPKLTIDTSQVDQLSFPIQIQAASTSVIPVQLETYPTPTTMTVSDMGVNSAFTQDAVFAAYKTFLTNNADYDSTLVSDLTNPGSYLRITNPSDILSNDANAATNPLNWAFDQAVYNLFTAPPGNQLLVNTGNAGGLTNAVFIGTPGTQTIGKNNYQVLQFSSAANPSIGTLYVYMPLFSDNCTGAPKPSLYQSVPAPSWIKSGQTCGFMVFANAGVFTDSGSQPGLSTAQQAILGNIEDQLVTAINRGCASSPLASYPSNTQMWQDPSQHYPTGQIANAYGAFMHTYVSAGETIFYGAENPPQMLTYGLAYAIAYDDQGNLSTTMTVVNDITSPQVTLSAWTSQK